VHEVVVSLRDAGMVDFQMTNPLQSLASTTVHQHQTTKGDEPTEGQDDIEQHVELVGPSVRVLD
jgi:hypothetical protein